MNKKYFRIALISGLVALVVIMLSIAVVSSDTSQPKTQASNVESVTPVPGGLQRPQAEVSFNLRDGFVGRLKINDEIIPDDQMEKVESLGQYTFRPGKGKVFEIFEAGTHVASIQYWPADEPEPASPQSYSWEFRITS